MSRDQRGLSQGTIMLGRRPCPSNNPDHTILELPEEEARLLDLPAGQPVHVDRSRPATTGDLVWVELVRRGSTQRLVRRFTSDAGWVTLAVASPDKPAIMRRQSELLILGVVDEAPRCPMAAQPGALG